MVTLLYNEKYRLTLTQFFMLLSLKLAEVINASLTSANFEDSTRIFWHQTLPHG